MTAISRRSLLKTMGACAATSALSRFAVGVTGPPCSDGQVTLNVILHGLFVVDFTDTSIDLLAPNVNDHIYKAGGFSRDNICDLKDTPCQLTTGSSFGQPSLEKEGLTTINKQQVIGDIPGFSINSTKSRIHVELPFPAEIHPLRVLKGSDLYAGQHRKYIEVRGLSLCPVLIYPCLDPTKISLSNTTWHPYPNRYNTINLHFWAEPPQRVDHRHLRHAYKKMQDIVPLDFILIADDTPPIDNKTLVFGVHPAEEQGWSEWVSGGEGTRPENCNPLMTYVPVAQSKTEKGQP